MDTIFMDSKNKRTSDPHRLLWWNEEFELLDLSYSVSDIQYYFKHIFKKHKAVTDNRSIMTYVNKIEKRITFKIKIGYYVAL